MFVAIAAFIGLIIFVAFALGFVAGATVQGVAVFAALFMAVFLILGIVGSPPWPWRALHP